MSESESASLIDDVFLERLRTKVRNLEQGTDDPLPDTHHEYNNIVKGVVVRRFENEITHTAQYDVSFQLNGRLVNASTILVGESLRTNVDAAELRGILIRHLAESIALEIAKDWRV